MQALNALAVLSDSGAAKVGAHSSCSSHDDVHCSSGPTCPIDYATSDTALDTVVPHSSETPYHTTTPSKCAHHHHA
jgi:hypothetical protein